MRLVFLHDTIIKANELQSLQNDFAKFYTTHTKIVPEFVNIPFNYKNYATYNDNGVERPTDHFFRSNCKMVHDKYGDSVDHVVFLVHENNFKSDPPGPGGIWGTNYSNIYSGYQVQYCRFDRDNMANSFGTLYHEVHHSHDAMIKTYLAVDIAPLVGVSDWDRDITHGKSEKWSYIRHKENIEALKAIGPLLKTAYTKRRNAYKLSLLETVLILARRLLNMKISKPTP